MPCADPNGNGLGGSVFRLCVYCAGAVMPRTREAYAALNHYRYPAWRASSGIVPNTHPVSSGIVPNTQPV